MSLSMKLAPQSRARVLCLHSFRTSGAIFQQQLQRAGLLDALSDLIEFTFIDAPHPASGPIPRDVRPYFEGPYHEWFTAESVGDRVEFDEVKLQASERFIISQLTEKGPFDAVMGFSQGAVIASVMVALQRSGMRPHMSALPQLRFCVLFAGMKSRHPEHVAAFEALSGKVPCPSLHIYGDKDALKNPHCVELADSFQASTVLLHQRGHAIPALQGPQLAVARAFVVAAARGVAQQQPLSQQQQQQRRDQAGVLRQPTGISRAVVAASAPQRVAKGSRLQRAESGTEGEEGRWLASKL